MRCIPEQAKPDVQEKKMGIWSKGEIYVSIWTNVFVNFDKYGFQFRQIHTQEGQSRCPGKKMGTSRRFCDKSGQWAKYIYHFVNFDKLSILTNTSPPKQTSRKRKWEPQAGSGTNQGADQVKRVRFPFWKKLTSSSFEFSVSLTVSPSFSQIQIQASLSRIMLFCPILVTIIRISLKGEGGHCFIIFYIIFF